MSTMVLGTDIELDSYNEFCESLDEIGFITHPELYIDVIGINEAVVDGRMTASRSLQRAWDNTKEGTKKTLTAYGDITDGGGSILKATFDITMGLIGLISKAIKFILINMAKVLTLVHRVGQKIYRIPGQILVKIRGDIELYITPSDLQKFYNQVFPKIKEFMVLGREMAKGQMWGTMFNKDLNRDGIQGNNVSDMKISRNMEKIFDYLQQLEFHPTVYKMDTVERINAIFSSTSKIEFTDLSGKKQTGNYIDLLTKLLQDMEVLREPLQKLGEEIGVKIDKTNSGDTAKLNANEIKGQWSNLSESAKERVAMTIRMTSKIIQIIGNVIRFITKDMNTLSVNSDRLLTRSQEMGLDKEEKEKAHGEKKEKGTEEDKKK